MFQSIFYIQFLVKYQDSFKSSKLVVNWLFFLTLNPLESSVLAVFEDNHRVFKYKNSMRIFRGCKKSWLFVNFVELTRYMVLHIIHLTYNSILKWRIQLT